MNISSGAQANVTLWKISGDDSIKVAELTLPIRSLLECGVIEYNGEYFSFYRLEESTIYFMLCGGILKVDHNDKTIHRHH
jgi:hypothetical protein